MDIGKLIWNVMAWIGIFACANVAGIIIWMMVNDIEERIKFKKQKKSTAYEDHIGFLNRKDDLT